MKTFSFLFIVATMVLFGSAKAAVIDITSSQNWSTAGIGSSDFVYISNGAVLTVDGTFSCLAIYVGQNSSGTPSDATLLFNSGSQLTVNGDLNFHNSSTGTIDMTNGGTFIFRNIAPTSAAMPVLNAGTGTIQINATTSFTTPASSGFRTFNNVVFNPSTSITITFYTTGTPSYTFNNVTKNGAGSVTLGTCNVSIAGNLTVNAGTFTFSGTSTKSITGDVSLTGGTFSNSTSGVTVGGDFNLSGGTYSGSGSVSISGALSASSGTSTISNSGNFTVTQNSVVSGTLSWTNSSGTKTFNNDLEITSSGSWVCTVNRGFTISGDTVKINGSITPGTGTYTFNNGGTVQILGSATSPALGAVSISTASTTFTVNTDNKLTLLGSLTGSGTFTLPANKTVQFNGATNSLTGTFNVNNTNSKVIYGGTGAATSKASTYYELEIDKSSATLTMGGATTVTTNLTITSGTFSSGANNLSVNGNTSVNGTFTSSGGTKTFSGNLTVNSGGTVTITGSAGTYNFANDVTNNGTWNNTATGGTYNLSGSSKSISGTVIFVNTAVSGSYTNNNTLTVANLTGSGTLTQGASSTLTITGSTITISNLNPTGTGNTVIYNSTSAQTVLAKNYKNLTISGSRGTNNVTLPSGTIGVEGTFTDNATFTTGNYVVTGNTISFSGTSTISGSGTNTRFNNFTIASGTTTGKSGEVKIMGNFTCNGTYNHNNGTLNFNAASGTQTLSGSGTANIYDLTVDHATSGGAQITSGTFRLYGSLELLNSATTFDAGTDLLTLKSTDLENNKSARIGDLTGRTFTGSITWERYISGNTTWRQISCPISGKTLADWEDSTNFPMSGFPGATGDANGFISVYYYDESKASLNNDFDSGWVAPTDITDAMSPSETGMKGWMVYVGQTADMSSMNPFTISLSGNIISGTQNVTLSNGNPGFGHAASETGYHLLANPYPSQIDISASGWSDIDGYYSLDPSTGNFDFYDLTTLTPSGTATGIVAQGQAFLVYTQTDNNTISFTESMKTSSGGTEEFLRKPYLASDGVLEIKITTDINNFSDYTKIIFDEDANPNYLYASGDARKIKSPEKRAPQIYSLSSDGKKLLINKYKGLSNKFVIPITIYAPDKGTFTLSGKGIKNKENHCLKLWDRIEKREVLLENDFQYSFKTSSGGLIENRFFVINNSCVSEAEPLVLNSSVLKISQGNKELSVKIESDNREDISQKEIEIVNMNGQVVYRSSQTNLYEDFKINLRNFTEGIYAISVRNGYQTLSEKFVIK